MTDIKITSNIESITIPAEWTRAIEAAPDKRMPWRPEQLAFLKQWGATKTAGAIGKIIGKTKSATSQMWDKLRDEDDPA